MLNLNSFEQHRIMSSDNASALSAWWQTFKEKLQVTPPESFDSWEHRPVTPPTYEDDDSIADSARQSELDDSWLFPEREIPDVYSTEAFHHPATRLLWEDDE